MPMLKKIIFFVILLPLISFVQLPFYGYCGDWVKIGGNEHLTLYYDPLSVNIDKENKNIKVWVRNELTDKGRISFLESKNSIEKQKYSDIKNVLYLLLFNYKELKYTIKSLSYNDKSDNVLVFAKDIKDNWRNIQPYTGEDMLFKKLLKDNNIQM